MTNPQITEAVEKLAHWLPTQGPIKEFIHHNTLHATWGVNQDWKVHTGLELVHTHGHHDPGGLYNGFAAATGQTNISSLQTIPYVGFDDQLTKATSWGMDFRYYTTTDRGGRSVFDRRQHQPVRLERPAGE